MRRDYHSERKKKRKGTGILGKLSDLCCYLCQSYKNILILKSPKIIFHGSIDDLAVFICRFIRGTRDLQR
jgi:hypothetical protein